MHGYRPSGPVQALVLQGKLLHVQEDGAAETERKVAQLLLAKLNYNQCFGSGSGWIRIQIARLDPYSESGSVLGIRIRIRNLDPDPESEIEL